MYEYFVSKNHDCPQYEVEDKFRNYHMDCEKEWNKILHILDIENEIDDDKVASISSPIITIGIEKMSRWW